MKKWHAVAAFIVGLLAGCFAGPCLVLLPERWPRVGGEALILPLIGLLVWFGCQLGKETHSDRIWREGYLRGYIDGSRAMRLTHTGHMK